jgi:hypothetical protein
MAAFVVWFAVRGPARVRSSFERGDDLDVQQHERSLLEAPLAR